MANTSETRSGGGVISIYMRKSGKATFSFRRLGDQDSFVKFQIRFQFLPGLYPRFEIALFLLLENPSIGTFVVAQHTAFSRETLRDFFKVKTSKARSRNIRKIYLEKSIPGDH